MVIKWLAFSSQLRKGRRERKPLAEAYGWLFVDFVPLLYEKRRVARQLQVETWLDLTQLLNELKLELVDNRNIGQNANVKAKIDYVA
ncbi:MAG: hypothetical protein QXG76_04975 [Candidatus Bathyarchaeia archaeon]